MLEKEIKILEVDRDQLVHMLVHEHNAEVIFE